MTNDQTPEQTDPIVSVDAEQQEPEEQPAKAGREAAKYRRQLRDTEAETEQLRAELAVARAEKLQSALSDYRVKIETPQPDGATREQYLIFDPRATADSGLSETVFDGGTINPERLQKAMRELFETKPYMFGNHVDRLRLSREQSVSFDLVIKKAMQAARGDDFTAAFSPDKQ